MLDKAVDVDNQLRDGEYQVYESFVKEKNVILNYVFDLVLFAAKIHDIKSDDIFQTELYRKRAANLQSQIKNEKDAVAIKNRVTWIIMKYQMQSSVLDPLLGEFVEPIMRFI